MAEYNHFLTKKSAYCKLDAKSKYTYTLSLEKHRDDLTDMLLQRIRTLEDLRFRAKMLREFKVYNNKNLLNEFGDRYAKALGLEES